MSDPATILLKSMQTARDLQPVWLTRAQLKELIERLLIAEGMKIEQAKIHADMRVAAYVAQLNNIDSIQ